MPLQTKKNGFTIIELLISLSLMMMIMSFTFIAFNRSTAELINGENLSLASGELNAFEIQFAKDIRYASNIVVDLDQRGLTLSFATGNPVVYSTVCVNRPASYATLPTGALDEINTKMSERCGAVPVCNSTSSVNPQVLSVSRTVLSVVPSTKIFPSQNYNPRKIKTKILSLGLCLGEINIGLSSSVETQLAFAMLDRNLKPKVSFEPRIYVSISNLVSSYFNFY